MMVIGADQAKAAPPVGETPEQLALKKQVITTNFLTPHHAQITADMMINVRDWYGVPIDVQFAILGAETSMGHLNEDGSVNPKMGGSLVAVFNYGCMRFGIHPKVTELALKDPIWIRGKDWYKFASPELGMYAWGRYMKVGAKCAYPPLLFGQNRNWTVFAGIYYGKGVSGLAGYIRDLKALDAKADAIAAANGFSWH